MAFRAGSKLTREAAGAVELDQWQTLLGEMDSHLKANHIAMESDSIRLSPMLELDAKTEQFVGDHAENANQYLKREYRSGFEVPSIT